MLGEYDLLREDDDAKPLRLNVAESISHPLYKRRIKYNDIGLIRMDRKISFSEYMRPACLPETYDSETEKALATGYGKTDFKGRSSHILMKVVLELFSVQECNTTYQQAARTSVLRSGILPASQFCAGSHTEKKDTCQVSLILFQGN